MAETTGEKKGLKEKVVEELKLLGLIGLYIWLVLTMLDLYRRSVLHGIDADPWRMGVDAITALLLAKVVIIEDLLKVSHRYRDRSLIWPTLQRAVLFGVFAILLNSIEVLVRSLLHHDGMAAAIDAVLNHERGLRLIHAGLLTLATIPLFATWEVTRVIGGDKLREMFFGKAQ